MRNKLRLELEQLAVESFDTTRPAVQRGTVFGEECTCQTACTCPGCPTCYASCNGANTCANTCGYSCDDYTCIGTCNTCNETDCDCSINATRCGGYICP